MITNDYYSKHNILVKRFFIFLFSLCFIAIACNKESTDIDTSPKAQISIYAVAPGAPDLNIFLNGNNIAASVPFNSYTLYNKVSPGTVEMRIQSSTRDVSIDTSFSVAENKYYSAFLTGTKDDIKPIILHDSFPAPYSGFYGLRFLVLSPGVPTINFHVLKDSTIKKDSTTKDTIITKILANRSYGDNIASDTINTFKKFAAGTYSFYALNSSDNKDTLARLTNKTFSDSSNYTLMLEGLYNKSTNDTSLLIGIRLH